ncbi:transcription repressor NadR [Clostridium hydrogeniformans]|uniref:transcription repressor NadR n=1 Tax=Clostridium hydrogeniformans TaxID=349933 RepID=UPI0004866F45|nr:transcription repressor NadR [Clostridium hydrogeniformans]
MNSKERRLDIIRSLNQSQHPIKGCKFAEDFEVTRQVIVKDIAILRAEGNDIIATPEGYVMNRKNNLFRRIIVSSHEKQDIRSELESIIKYGGIIEDVIIEHPFYGEIKAMMMLKTLEDIDNFTNEFNNAEIAPLSVLTGGIHLHTISAESEEILNKIEKELGEKGFLISD